MTDDNSTASNGGNNLVDNDLDAFSAELFGSDKQEVIETDDDTVATEPDEDAPQEEEPDEDDSDEVGEEAPKPKKRQSAKERIEELYANNKRLERELAQARATRQEAPKEDVPEQKPASATPVPSPDDVNEDGEPKYLLGEFDPLYIKDLTHFYNEQDRAEYRANEAKRQEQAKIEAELGALKDSWADKVSEAEQELPDLREKLESLTETFATIEPSYGEFLAASIMSCDNGPKIMYFLSQNIDEAQRIVASGPQAALIALGKLEARFLGDAPKPERQKKPSLAPEPPLQRTRGAGGQFEAPDDTPDLAAFEKKFYVKK